MHYIQIENFILIFLSSRVPRLEQLSLLVIELLNNEFCKSLNQRMYTPSIGVVCKSPPHFTYENKFARAKTKLALLK